MQELEKIPESVEGQNMITSQTIAKKKDVLGTSNFEAAVGMSRKWDAREAGREVAETAIRQLHEPPSFFLLFSTIHYENHGGFQEFLNGVWDVLPEGTPLVGGTVAGFMNNYGCYTRGATSFAVSCLDIDVKVGIGHNTKRNPEKAVENASANICKKMQYDNIAIIEILPTAVIPNIPGLGQKNVILSKKLGSAFIKLLPVMKKLNYGYDRADEVLQFLSERFEDGVIIGGCTMDDNKFLRNYQFHNREIEKNTLLTLCISTPKKIHSRTIIGYKAQDKKFQIDHISSDKHVINKIDGQGARSALSKKLNLKIEEKDAVYQLYKNIYYYPLGFKKQNIWHPCMIGLIYGENLIFGNKIEGDTLTLLYLSIEETIKKIKENVNELSEKKPSCIFGFACETFIETLGKDIFEVQKSINTLKIPFVIPFVAGESIYTPEIGAHHLYESANLLVFDS